MDAGKEHEVLSMAEAGARLTEHFSLPAVSKAELSVAEAEAVRKRESRQAALDRQVAKQAAINAATHAWWKQQAELACELGITWSDWQRISTLLSKPPPSP